MRHLSFGCRAAASQTKLRRSECSFRAAVSESYLLDHAVGDNLRAFEIFLGVVSDFKVVEDYRLLLARFRVEFRRSAVV